MGRWLVWVVVVLAWTAALEFPVPDPGDIPAAEFLFTYKYWVAKSVHVLAYCGLTVLCAWVPVPGHYRWIMMFLLMGHAWGTERLQELLWDYCHRGGSLKDVGFDIIGIIIGVALSWKLWMRDDKPHHQNASSMPHTSPDRF